MDIPSVQAELELEYDATLGECPVWDDQNQLLYWVDILSGHLFQYNPESQRNKVFEIGEHLGSFALREKGGAVLARKSGFAFYDFDQKQISAVSDPESHLHNHRFNDGKCDPMGRFWACTLSYNLDKGAGSLYCLYPDLRINLKDRDFTIPNGLVWDLDNEKFYVNDSIERTIISYRFDPESGDISNRSVITTLDEDFGLPDGMTLDRENKLWVALYNGHKVARIDPESGEVLHKVMLPVPQVTSCTFGGPNMDELYITTAREHMTAEDVKKAPLSGSLFKAKVPVKGSPASRFKG